MLRRPPSPVCVVVAACCAGATRACAQRVRCGARLVGRLVVVRWSVGFQTISPCRPLNCPKNRKSGQISSLEKNAGRGNIAGSGRLSVDVVHAGVQESERGASCASFGSLSMILCQGPCRTGVCVLLRVEQLGGRSRCFTRREVREPRWEDLGFCSFGPLGAPHPIP